MLVSLLWANLALAQSKVDPGSSHVPIPPRPGQPDPEKVFAERFGRATAIEDLARILEKLYPEHSREQILKELKNSNIDWNDPQLRQQLAELAKHPDLLKNALPPADLEKLKKQVQNQLPNLPLQPPTGSNDRPPVGNPPMPPDLPPTGTPNLPSIPEPPPEQIQAREEAEEMMRWLSQKLEGLADKVDDSPALRKMLRELSEGLLANGMGNGEGIDQQLARWNGWFKDARDWVKPITSTFREIEMPRINWGGGGSNVGQILPRAGTVQSATAFWPVIAWTILIGLVVWALWKVAIVPLRRLAADSGWHLGPWPVRPEAISNRRELIQGFEYLSLLRLGQPAQCWNHREIARQLGDEPASRLAGLYEQARYAPEEEPLSSEQLARARQDLCELARM